MGADESSRNRIRTEIDNSFFISAGAGAGKTSLVVDRVMELLKAGKKPSEIVVITFTEAAAAELIERFIAFVISWLICVPLMWDWGFQED